MKLSICNELFQDWPLEKVFAYAAKIGYDGVEIAPYTLADSVTEISTKKRALIRKAAEDNGLEIVGLHWLLVKPEGLYINHPDELIRVRTQEYMEELIHFCADIGGKLLVHGSPHQRTVKERWDFHQAWEDAKETFRVVLDLAQKRDVVYCIEPLPKSKTNFINTVEEALRMVQEIRHPHFKMAFQCQGACIQEASMTEALLRALRSGRLSHIHMSEADGSGPGFGKTKFLPLLKILAGNNYRGYVSVEVTRFDVDPQTVASRSIGYLRGLLEHLSENL